MSNVIALDSLGACVASVMQTMKAKNVIICVEYETGELQASHSGRLSLAKFCEMTAFANYWAFKWINEQSNE